MDTQDQDELMDSVEVVKIHSIIDKKIRNGKVGKLLHLIRNY